MSGFNDFSFPDGDTWVYTGSPSFAQSNACNAGRSFRIVWASAAHFEDYAQWANQSPPDVEITGAWTPAKTMLVNGNAYSAGYNFRYLYAGGTRDITAGASCCGGMDYGSQINQPFQSRWFIVQVTCNNPGGCNDPGGNSELIDVPGIELSAVDNTPPTVTALGTTNLWYQGAGWVRGTWPIDLQGTADDGICDMWAVVDGGRIQGPTATPDQHTWTQCPSPETWRASVDTSRYPDGALSFQVGAGDAANPANVNAPQETLRVDNTPVTLSLSGPTSALSTAGTQYVTATATAGPSGVAGIWCSIDGSPVTMHAGDSWRIPIEGLGSHGLSCEARNNARDSSGAPGSSPTQTWSLSIRQPAVATASFAAVVDGLRCHHVAVRARIRARWVTVTVHGRPVKIKLPAQTRIVKITKCRARLVRRRVNIGGHWYTETIVALPHTVERQSEHVGFGRIFTLSGWLGTQTGNALGGTTVRILTAPDVPGAQFHPAASTTTRRDGSWSAKLTASSSLLVQASYGGTPTVQPVSSAPILAVVRAPIRLSIHPAVTHWEGTIAIRGRLGGCCVPTPSGELVVLHVGWPGGSAEIGHVYAGAGGPGAGARFHASYTFLRGTGTETYRIWASTAAEADYPYAAGSSRKVRVTVRPG